MASDKDKQSVEMQVFAEEKVIKSLDSLRQPEQYVARLRSKIYKLNQEIATDFSNGLNTQANKKIERLVKKIGEYKTAVNDYDKQLSQSVSDAGAYGRSLNQMRIELSAEQSRMQTEINDQVLNNANISTENQQTLATIDWSHKSIDALEEELGASHPEILRKKLMKTDEFGGLVEITEKGPFSKDDIIDINAHYAASYETLLQNYINMRYLAQTSNPELQNVADSLKNILIDIDKIHQQNPDDIATTYHLAQAVTGANRYANATRRLANAGAYGIEEVSHASMEFKQARENFNRFVMNFEHKSPSIFKKLKVGLLAFGKEIANSVVELIDKIDKKGKSENLQKLKGKAAKKAMTFKHDMQRVEAGRKKDSIEIGGNAAEGKKLYQDLDAFEATDIKQRVVHKAIQSDFTKLLGVGEEFEDRTSVANGDIKPVVQQLAWSVAAAAKGGTIEVDSATSILQKTTAFAENAIKLKTASIEDLTNLQQKYINSLQQDFNTIEQRGQNPAPYKREAQDVSVAMGKLIAKKMLKTAVSQVANWQPEAEGMSKQVEALKKSFSELKLEDAVQDGTLPIGEALNLAQTGRQFIEATINQASLKQQGKSDALSEQEYENKKENYAQAVYNANGSASGETGSELFTTGFALEAVAESIVNLNKRASLRN